MIRLLLLLLLTPGITLGVEVNVTVTERADVARHHSHILSTIPFARTDGVFRAEQLRVEGKRAEFTVLSRYGGTVEDTTKPVRAVLAEFQDDFSASRQKHYLITTSGGGQQPLGNTLARESRDAVTIDTGTARFRISKTSGNLFDLVQTNGATVINRPQQSGMEVRVKGRLYSSRFSRPQVEIFRNGRLSAVVVVRGVLQSRDHQPLRPPQPAMKDAPAPDSVVEYAWYYTFFKEKSFVFVEQTLKNNGRGWSRFPTTPVEHLFLDSWRTTLQLTILGSRRSVRLNGFTEEETTSRWSLLQRDRNSHGFEVRGYKFTAVLKRNGHQEKKWRRYRGGFAVDNGTAGVLTGEKWFWQNCPNGWSLVRNTLHSDFLPPRPADYPGFTPPPGVTASDLPRRWLNRGPYYRMPGGMWKTHRTVYYFYNGQRMDDAEVLAELRSPLQMQFSPAWWGHSNFFGTLFNPDFKVHYTFAAGEKLQKAITRWRRYARSIWDPHFDHRTGVSFPTLRKRRRVPLWGWQDRHSNKKFTYPSWYGWLRFGGSPRSLNFGFNSQHYDFSTQAWLVWQREKFYPAYKLYEELVEHQADILTLHDPEAKQHPKHPDDILLNGAQRYEQDALGDNYTSRTFPINDPHWGNAHEWTDGLFIYYLLTGSPRYKEVLDACLDHVVASKNIGAAKGELRDLGRLIGAALNYYDVFGGSAALEDAWQIWLRLEKNGVQIGSNMFAMDSRIKPDKIWIGYDSMTLPYLIRLYYTLAAAEMNERAGQLKKRLFEMARWNNAMVLKAWPHPPGSYGQGKRTYYKYTTANALYLSPEAQGDMSLPLPYHWGKKHYNANYVLAWCDLYAFMYRETGDEQWLIMARTAFKDRFRYNPANLSGQLEHPRKPFWQPYGINPGPNSGSWKFGMPILVPLFYLQTEQWKVAGWKPLTPTTGEM